MTEGTVGDKITEGRALLAAGTQGEWEVRGCVVPGEAVDTCYTEGTTHVRSPICTTVAEHGLPAKANAALIAFAVNNLPALLDIAEAAARRRDEEKRDIPLNEPIPSEEWEAAERDLTAALDRLED